MAYTEEKVKMSLLQGQVSCWW